MMTPIAVLDVLLLDVGHGSCALAIAESRTIVIDGAPGVVLLETLEAEGIAEIDAVLISHADEDHIGGIVELLNQGSIRVKRVLANPDSSKATAAWRDLRAAVSDAMKRGTALLPSLTTNDSAALSSDDMIVDVLHPNPVAALGAAGGSDTAGRRMTSNSMSAVVRIRSRDGASILLTGDLDRNGLDNAVEDGANLSADALVFPHHGGLCGDTDVEGFTDEVAARVDPEVVLFSIDRVRYGLPREDVMAAIRKRQIAHVACTQLSQKCAAELPATDDQLEDIPAKGRQLGQCCAGSIRLDLATSRPRIYRNRELHARFVGRAAPTALCVPAAL
jgi:competence protein ComEC